MSMRKLVLATGLLLTLGAAALAEGPQLGKPISPSWNSTPAASQLRGPAPCSPACLNATIASAGRPPSV